MQQKYISMTRHTGSGSVRYYKLKLLSTLFGGFLVEREFGNAQFRAPTGIKRDFFDSYESAALMFDRLVKQKQKRGYRDGRGHRH